MPFPPLPPSLSQQLSLPLDSKDLTIPHFAALYRYLTTEVLDSSDASTISNNQAYEAEGIESQLKDQWVSDARQAILIKALRDVCVDEYRSTSENGTRELSTPARELGLIIAAYLSHEVGNSNTHHHDEGEVETNTELSDPINEIDDLLSEDIEAFQDNIDEYTTLISRYLTSTHNSIIEMLSLIPTAALGPSPDSQPFTSSRSRSNHSSPSASTILSQQITTCTTQLHLIPNLVSSLTSTLQTLLSLQSAILTSSVIHSETFTNSTQSRNLLLHSQFLSTVAKGIEWKTQIMQLLQEKEIYAQSPIGIRFSDDRKLERFMEILKEEEDGVDNELRELEGLLREFEGDGKGGLLRELGREYKRLERECEVVMGDIERLEREGLGGLMI